MSDESKTDDHEEPIDAEFETLQSDADNSGASTEVKKPGNGRVFLILALVVLVLVMIASGAFFINRKVLGDRGNQQVDSAALLARLARLDSLERDVNQVKTKAESANALVEARLEKLENAPADNKFNPQVIRQLQERIDALESADEESPQAIGSIMTRLDKLETQMRTGAMTRADNASGEKSDLNTKALSAINDRIAALESKIAQVSQASSDPNGETQMQAVMLEIENIKTRLSALENQTREGGKATALTLSILALDSAALTGAPFEHEWQNLAALLPQNPDVQRLAPLAKTGVATRMALVRDFTQLRRSINEASTPVAMQKENKKPGALNKARHALGSLISIKRVNEENGVDAVFAHAQSTLEAGDITGAVEALKPLGGQAHARVQNWLTQAQMRITLEQSLARLKIQAAEVSP